MQPAEEKSYPSQMEMSEPSSTPLPLSNRSELSLLLVGTSFRNSPIAFRESIFRYLSEPKVRERIHNVPHVAESALLCTCNRIEAYFTTSDAASTVRGFFDLLDSLSGSRPELFYEHRGMAVINHLFSVASGLDSMVVGEEQILDQVRDAGVAERIAGHSKGTLSALFDASHSAGKRVRSYSKRRAESSISAYALKLALKKLGHPPRTTTLIGSGKTIRLAAKELKDSSLFVVTSRDDALVPIKNVNFIRRGQLRERAGMSDLIIAATRHPGYVLGKADLDRRIRRVVLDLGFPRNVDPSVKELDSTMLYDLDALAREAARSPAHADATVMRARRKVAREAAAFHDWLNASRLSAQLPMLHRLGEKVREEELAVALRRLPRLSERDRRVVEAMSRRLVSKLLSRPTRFAKEPDADMPQGEKLRLVERVFLLGRDDEE